MGEQKQEVNIIAIHTTSQEEALRNTIDRKALKESIHFSQKEGEGHDNR